MSEKRLYSYDKGNNKILCNLNDVCDFNVSNVFQLLNSLAAENEQLKYDNFMFKGSHQNFRKLAISERKKLERQVDEQQDIIEEQNKEIEESKITIQLYETDVSMRDNFLKSKELYDEFLQCNMGGA